MSRNSGTGHRRPARHVAMPCGRALVCATQAGLAAERGSPAPWGAPPPASGRGWAYSGAQAWLRPPLIQGWLRSGPESPTLAPRKPKSAGRVGSPPEWETALLRGTVWTGPDQHNPEGGPAPSRGRLCVQFSMWVPAGDPWPEWGARGAVMNRHSAPNVGNALVSGLKPVNRRTSRLCHTPT